MYASSIKLYSANRCSEQVLEIETCATFEQLEVLRRFAVLVIVNGSFFFYIWNFFKTNGCPAFQRNKLLDKLANPVVVTFIR